MNAAATLPGTTVCTTDRPSLFAPILEDCKRFNPAITAVVHPVSPEAILGAVEAEAAGLIRPIYIGPSERIQMAAEEAGVEPLPAEQLMDVPHSHAAAEKAVHLARAGQVELLMKGSLHTDELLSVVVQKDHDLRTHRRLSHVFVMDVPSYHKLLLLTDAAINIYPELSDRVDIVQNAIELAHVLGLALPKVALLSAVETVNPSIRSTIEAAALCKMADRGQITGGLLDGPLAFDNSISPEAAAAKGIVSAVAGDADILVVPDMEAGNMLAKQLTYLAGAVTAGIVLGARLPIVLTSRADGALSRKLSAALGLLLVRQHVASIKPRGHGQRL
jgi:phosphotransacetylase